MSDFSVASGRTLLLSGTAPGEPGVGGVILQDLMQSVGLVSMTCVWLAPRNLDSSNRISGLDIRCLERRYETAWRPVPGMAGELLSFSAAAILRGLHLFKMKRHLQTILDSDRFDSIVCVLESRAAIDLAWHLQPRTRIPWRCIVWDDVQLVSQQSALDRWSSSQLERRFGTVLQRSEDVAVICENMQDEYRQRYGIDSFVLRHGVSTESVSPLENPPNGEQGRRPFLIGFAGSITAPDCFEHLIGTLDSIHWKVGDRPIVLRVLGARYTVHSTVPQRIEYYGWRCAGDTQFILSQCDVMYLPQSFSESLRYFSQLSFPTKLSTYVTTNRPIILHAPEYASLSTFWRDQPMGPLVSSLSSGELQAAIATVAGEDVIDLPVWLANSRHVAGNTLGVEQFQIGAKRILTGKGCGQDTCDKPACKGMLN